MSFDLYHVYPHAYFFIGRSPRHRRPGRSQAKRSHSWPRAPVRRPCTPSRRPCTLRYRIQLTVLRKELQRSSGSSPTSGSPGSDSCCTCALRRPCREICRPLCAVGRCGSGALCSVRACSSVRRRSGPLAGSPRCSFAPSLCALRITLLRPLSLLRPSLP